MNTRLCLAVLAWLSGIAIALPAPAVRLWQTNLVIPTYLAAPPSAVPRFYEGRTYQGAKATFYPYPVQDVLTDVKSNVTYKALFLENQYLQISVIPELGGRIFSATDKANGYEFFYRQHVIKPALIGMLGAWISGGVEWNVPHHHRATSFSPVDSTTTTNADGSATIWVGEIELRSRMKWLVGMTLYPDRSYLELTCKVFNRTPFAHPMLFWINAAVHCGPDYQVIFPPSTEWAAQHSKPEFASWPIAHQTYGGTDYTRGVDISWWKNHPNPVSFFCWNDQDDWFGGYDHGKQAGVIHVADHHVAPGKKFFEWGNGPEGETWSKILTDDDGPYLELMAGAWSDNQPDYSWIQPGETRAWKHWWYPVRNLGGMKAANRDGAVNMEMTNGIVKVAVNTTAVFSNVEVELMLWGTNAFWGWTTNISPQQPFTIQIPVSEFGMGDAFLDRMGVKVTLRTPGTDRQTTLLSFFPSRSRKSPMPKPVEKPKSPKDYGTADELYFTGQRIEQLYSPSFEAAPYYAEILRRDPDDYRANTALGVLLCKQWRWNEAAKHLSNAVARATANHIRPNDGEAFYYLGVALRGQAGFVEPHSSNGREQWPTKLAGAAAMFHKAAWSVAWQVPSLLQLAEIECASGRYLEALDSLDQCLAKNERSPSALNLRSAILRRLWRLDEATACSTRAMVIDPIDGWSRIEHYLAAQPQTRLFNESRGRYLGWRAIPHDLVPKQDSETLELVVNYARAGLKREADYVAWAATTDAAWEQIKPVDPVLHFWAARLTSVSKESIAQYSIATNIDHFGDFPFQHESMEILSEVTNGAVAATQDYLLGNLLYDNQPDTAIKAWEESRQRDDRSALTHRNLALAYAQHEKNIPKAIASLEKAVELNPNEARFFYELDVQYEAGGAPVAQRLAMLTKHHAVAAQRDDALTREIGLRTVAGQADQALALLRGRHFRNWEGSSQIHGVYVDACLAHGQQLLAEKHPREALREFEAALEYPANLEVGKARRAPRTAQIQFLMGTAHEALGEAAPAKTAFEKAVSGKAGGASEGSYFHALALQKLGRADEAKPLFEALVKAGEEQLAKGEAADYFAKFGEKTSERARKANAHYLVGLGHLGLGEKAKADAAFKQALAENPSHLGTIAQVIPSQP